MKNKFYIFYNQSYSLEEISKLNLGKFLYYNFYDFIMSNYSYLSFNFNSYNYNYKNMAKYIKDDFYDYIEKKYMIGDYNLKVIRDYFKYIELFIDHKIKSYNIRKKTSSFKKRSKQTKFFKKPSYIHFLRGYCSVVKEELEPEFRGKRSKGKLIVELYDVFSRRGSNWKDSSKKRHQYEKNKM